MRKIRNPNREDVIPVRPEPVPSSKPSSAKAAAPASSAAQPAKGKSNTAAPAAASSVSARKKAVAAATSGAASSGKPSDKTSAKPAPADTPKPKQAADETGKPKRPDPEPQGKTMPSSSAAKPTGAIVVDVERETIPADRLKDPRYQKALQVVRRHTLLAGGASCIPLPGADVLSVTGIQANLAEEISKAYGFTPTPGWSLRLAGLFAFSAGGSALGQVLAASAAKALPGLGLVVGVGGIAAYSAATTCALGRSIIHHYEKGGRPEHIVCASFMRAVRDGLAAGRETWQYWKSLTQTTEK